MRLSFANAEHADFVVTSGALSLGSAEGNTLVLPGRDVVAWHARVTLDARGIVLEVLDPRAQTHVNARPVREKALLRCGDVLCLGRVAMTLKADRDELIDTSLPPPGPVPSANAAQVPRVSLRGVAGSHFGKTVAVAQRLVIGRGADCGLVIGEARIAPQHAVIENVDNLICMRELDGAGGACVNGIPVGNAILHPGDQLTFGSSQFIVEAPGFPLRGEEAPGGARAITEQLDAVVHDDATTPPRQGQGGIWWLIGAAAVIALTFALLIYRGI